MPLIEKVMWRLHLSNEHINSTTSVNSEIDLFSYIITPQNLCLLAGRESVGKTTFLANVVTHNATKNNFQIGIITLGLTPEKWAERIIINKTGIPLQTLSNGKLSVKELQLINNKNISDEFVKILLNDSCFMAFNEIEQLAIRWIKENNINILIIDGLDMLEEDEENINSHRIARYKKLKELAVNYNISIVASMTLNTLKIDNRFATLKTLGMFCELSHKEPLAIQENCDIILFMRRPEYYRETFGETIFSMEKNNKGALFSLETVMNMQLQKILPFKHYNPKI